jgi:hypothetical protein
MNLAGPNTTKSLGHKPKGRRKIGRTKNDGMTSTNSRIGIDRKAESMKLLIIL